MLDFRSALTESIHLPTPSLPEVLHRQGWNTSLFFSSDLNYSAMGNYARNQQFQLVKDRSTIGCSQQFSTTKTEIDGVNDICTVRNYLQWLDSNKTKKNFSVLWTNQTHSPYYADDRIVFSKENDRLNTYLNALHHTDSVFNFMMQQLEKRGKLNNSLVVFIADHGEAFGTHNQTLHASRIYEENVHIPCFFFNPLFFHGTSSSQIGGLIDIPPTLTHMLGLPKPDNWEGKSLLENAVPNRSFFVSPYTDLIIGTRHGNWKYIFNVDTEEPELYDLSKDPKELNEVSHMYPEVVKKEHEVLIAWFQYVEKNYSKWRHALKKK
jgi:arylsulfatase A-like enzyme